MIVTRADALKFLTSVKQELFVGVGETWVQRALKMQNTKSEKNITLTNCLCKVPKVLFWCWTWTWKSPLSMSTINVSWQCHDRRVHVLAQPVHLFMKLWIYSLLAEFLFWILTFHGPWNWNCLATARKSSGHKLRGWKQITVAPLH